MTMTYIDIPTNISQILQSIPLDGEIVRADPSDHCTLFYFEQEVNLDFALKIIPIIQKITAKTKPFIINLNKYSAFSSGKYEFPIVVKPKSPELMKLRAEIKDAFEENDIEFSNKFPKFVPHITLAYIKQELPDGKFDEVAFQINKINFCLNTDNKEKDILKVEFPFGNVVKYSNAYLDKFSGYFEKLAANDEK